MTDRDRLTLLKVRNEFDFVFKMFPDIKFGISGSQITNSFLRHHNNDFFLPPNGKNEKFDIDIYCEDIFSVNSLINKLENIFSREKNKFTKNIKINTTEFIQDNGTLKFDIITNEKLLGTPEKILENFDLILNSVMITDLSVVCHVDALEMIKRKEISFNGFKNLYSLQQRIVKYANRGFTLNNENNLILLKLIDMYYDRIHNQKEIEGDVFNTISDISFDELKYGCNGSFLCLSKFQAEKLEFKRNEFYEKKDIFTDKNYDFIDI